MRDPADDVLIAVWSGADPVDAPDPVLIDVLTHDGWTLRVADWAEAQSLAMAGGFAAVVIDARGDAWSDAALAVAGFVALCGGAAGPPCLVVAKDPDWAATAGFFRAGAADLLARSAAIQGGALATAVKQAVRTNRAAADRLTALKTAVARLSDSEHRHRVLFEQSRAAAFLIDPADGSVRDANPAAAEFVGRDRDSLRSANFFDLCGVDADELSRRMAEARSSADGAVLLPMPDSAGRPRRVAMQSGPMLLDGQGLVLAVLHDVSAAATAERRADALRHLMERLLAAAGEGVIGVGASGAAVFFNPAAERLTGWTAADLADQPLAPILWPDAPEDPIALALADGDARPAVELTLRRRDGGCVTVRCVVSPLLEDGAPSGAVAMLADISQERRARDALAAAATAAEEARRRLHDAIGAIAEGFVYYDPDDRLVLCNQPYRQHLGVVGEQLVPGVSFETLVRQAIAKGLYDQEIIDVEGFVAERMRRHHQPSAPFERLMTGGRWLMTSETRTADGGYVAVTTDITERKRLEAELRRLATTDSLTGAANRRSFLERGEAELERSRRGGRPLSLLMLDLDHFKRINDRHGHGVGDAVLKAFVQAAGETLRRIDVFGRLGGEEFAALLPDTSLHAACEAAERLRRAVAGLRIDAGSGRPPVRVTVSVGAAEARPHDEGLAQTLARADQALYAAKSGGRDRVIAA